MNELYIDSMAAAVDRLYDEADDDHRRRRRQREEDLLRRRQPQAHGPGDQGRRAGGLRAGRGDQGRPAPARDLPASRSSPRSTAPRSAAASRSRLACNHRIVVDDPKVEVGLPEASLGLLPGGGGVTRIVRMLGIQAGLMDVLLQGTRFKPGRRARRRASSTSWSPTREELVPAAKAWIKANPEAVAEPVGRRRLQDARRHAEPPDAGGVPAGVPGAAAQADQGRGLPGPAGDPVRRGRGRAGRLRHRLADRVALPDQPDRQPGLEEHDPGVLLRPAGDQLRLAAPAGHRAVQGHQGRRPRRRDDGRRHRLRRAPAPAWRSCSRTSSSRERREGQGLLREAARQGHLARQDAPRRRRPSCSAGSPRPRTRPTSPAATW